MTTWKHVAIQIRLFEDRERRTRARRVHVALGVVLAWANICAILVARYLSTGHL